MWKLIKILLFVGYVMYAFKFMDDSARKDGIVDGVVSLVVAILFGGGIFYLLWLQDAGESEAEEKQSNNSDKLGEFNVKKGNFAKQDVIIEKTQIEENLKKEISEAEEEYHKSVQADLYFEEGEINRNLKKYYEAIECYSKAIELEPHEDKYYYLRAKTMRIRAGELDTYRTDVLNQFVEGYTRLLNIERYNYYIKYDDGTPPPYCKKEIIDDYNKAIGLNSSDSKYYNNRGNVLWSIDDYDRAIELYSVESIYYFNRAYVKAHKEDYKGAIADYDKALTLNPNDAWAFNNRAWARESLGDYENAKQDFTKAYNLEPSIYTIEGKHFDPNQYAPYERPPIIAGPIDV